MIRMILAFLALAVIRLLSWCPRSIDPVAVLVLAGAVLLAIQ